MIYLLLISGIFMGWSLGASDSVIFSPAVSTRVVRYSTALAIMAVFIPLGAYWGGEGNIGKIAELATSNGVVGTSAFEAGLKAAIVLGVSAIVMFAMSFLKCPVSATQCLTAAIVGWGCVFADSMSDNLPLIAKFVSTWFINPLVSCAISFALVISYNKIIARRVRNLVLQDALVKWGFVLAGIMSSYSIGANNAAKVVGLYLGENNILQNIQLATLIGGFAIALGAVTYSKKMMFSVGSNITELSPTSGFLALIATALTIQFFSSKTLGINIPVAVSQSVVGAIIGAGLVHGGVNFKVLKKIFIAWIAAPVSAGAAGWFAAKIFMTFASHG